MTVPLRLYGLRKGTVNFITVLCGLFAIFTLAPIVWILINSTKNQANIFQSFGFWFSRPFVLWHNFSNLFQDVEGDGIYIEWLGNTALYADWGGVAFTVLSSLAGYGFARFSFAGPKPFFTCHLRTPGPDNSDLAPAVPRLRQDRAHQLAVGDGAAQPGQPRRRLPHAHLYQGLRAS